MNLIFLTLRRCVQWGVRIGGVCLLCSTLVGWRRNVAAWRCCHTFTIHQRWPSVLKKKKTQPKKPLDDYTPPLHAFTRKIRSVSCALVHLFILYSFVYFVIWVTFLRKPALCVNNLWDVVKMVVVCVVLGPAVGGLSEGQRCVCNVNTIKVLDMEGRGKKRGGLSGPKYPFPTNCKNKR